MKKDIRSYGYTELQKELEHLGEKAFRARQVYEWLHVKLSDSFAEMTNLSLKLREKLDGEYEIFPVSPVERQISRLDGTNKFLCRLWDGNMVESVLMRYKHGNSVCISSQAGCRMCILCFHDRRAEAEPYCFRDARADLSDPEDHRRTGIQCGGHGYGRTSG